MEQFLGDDEWRRVVYSRGRQRRDEMGFYGFCCLLVALVTDYIVNSDPRVLRASTVMIMFFLRTTVRS